MFGSFTLAQMYISVYSYYFMWWIMVMMVFDEFVSRWNALIRYISRFFSLIIGEMIGAVAYLLATISSTVVIRLSQEITDFLEEFQTKFLSCQMCVLQPDRFGARKSAFLSFIDRPSVLLMQKDPLLERLYENRNWKLQYKIDAS